VIRLMIIITADRLPERIFNRSAPISVPACSGGNTFTMTSILTMSAERAEA
jgi:hypothetical protein